MLEVEKAAEIMMKGIAARRAEINFPWQPALLAGLVRWLPRALYDRLVAATVLSKYGSKDPHD
jgi:short-subunit dehydrogenase